MIRTRILFTKAGGGRRLDPSMIAQVSKKRFAGLTQNPYLPVEEKTAITT